MPERTRDNLMVVLRESMGANRPDEALAPTGKMTTVLDGKEVELVLASFEFIGDMHIRFVFDGPEIMVNATPDDLARLSLSNVDAALAVAVANVKRVYGEPAAAPWTKGLMMVQGKSPDLDSSYFLDREFWRKLVRQYPEGVVVAVPKRGGLLYAPLSDAERVQVLKENVAYLHESSERQRVSSALYLFRDDKWSVYQAPVPVKEP